MKININGPINVTSYGYTTSYIATELHKLGHQVRLHTIPLNQAYPDPVLRPSISTIINSGFYFHNAPSIRIWHQFDVGCFYNKRGLRIGFPIFELEQLDPIEVHSMNSCDAVFVCSEWAKRVAIDNHVLSEDVIKVVPLGVDFDFFSRLADKRNGSPETVFLTYGKLEKRKGHDILPKIFNAAFNKNDNVRLIIKLSALHTNEQEISEYINTCRKTKIGDRIHVFVNTSKSIYDIEKYITKADCGVFLSRAEGWDLPLLEMMAAGRHVICTNVSGHTQFCNSDNAMLIDLNKKSPAVDGKFFRNKNKTWPDFDDRAVEQAVSHMRHIHNLKQSNKLGINVSGIETGRRLTWQMSAKTIIDSLRSLE